MSDMSIFVIRFTIHKIYLNINSSLTFYNFQNLYLVINYKNIQYIYIIKFINDNLFIINYFKSFIRNNSKLYHEKYSFFYSWFKINFSGTVSVWVTI